jgi:DNA repair protein RecN (Recombination protein N)
LLLSISIKDVVLIDQLTIEFGDGFCALTGETGAGKSILLDSLGLALGTRADTSLVRKGVEKAIVTAIFDVGDKHPARELLDDQGLDNDGDLILRRIVSRDGGSKAFINDQAVSVGLLKQIGDMLAEIHGQFETHGLFNPKTHKAILDEYAAIDAKTLPNLWNEWKAAERTLIEMQQDMEMLQAEESYLRQSLEDLDALDLKTDEEEHLSALRERLMNKEQITEALQTAYDVISSEGGAEMSVSKAWRVLENVSGKAGGEMAGILKALDSASAELQEALSEIQAISADIERDEYSLEEVDERLFSLRTQARKHDCSVNELIEVRDNIASKLGAIETRDDELDELVRKVQSKKATFVKEANRVSEVRSKTATKLDKLIGSELSPLKLEKARFVTSVLKSDKEADWGAHGIDNVEFLVATNPGSEPGPLNKVASGGELSRFMLAIKVVLAEIGSACSLVFDELDSGIGGATAAAVGERLARLAKIRQILVVTHSPQVASRARHHWIVLKEGTDDVRTKLIPLAELYDRREEIARMISGSDISEEARAAAGKLLETGT